MNSSILSYFAKARPVFFSRQQRQHHNTSFKMAWERLIRFVGEDDSVHYGEPTVSASELDLLAQQGQLMANELSGSDPFSCEPTGKVLKVKKLLGPLVSSNVPIVRCIGLNYIKHSKC